jgi:hypothetical protein
MGDAPTTPGRSSRATGHRFGGMVALQLGGHGRAGGLVRRAGSVPGLATATRVSGELLVTGGLIVALYGACQLWITGFVQPHAQDRPRNELPHAWATPASAPAAVPGRRPAPRPPGLPSRLTETWRSAPVTIPVPPCREKPATSSYRGTARPKVGRLAGSAGCVPGTRSWSRRGTTTSLIGLPAWMWLYRIKPS